ncbi:MAG: dihydrolipoyl dehydrogenase [Candidatus Omnitrophota bacterium]|nr:dihydrolipoyl dehydrogenase [Candidatus Omnitrophota bacterium]MBU1894271.1 dihydrolipoyl dehydrogenase [Candidatus Omnitrophota bacterium]
MPVRLGKSDEGFSEINFHKTMSKDIADMYDFVIIGSGPAGHSAAIRAAQLGLKTAVIEKNSAMFGGVCLNEGCIPAKSLYHNAKKFNIIKNGFPEVGLDVNCGVVNLGMLVKKSRQDTAVLRKGLEYLFRKNKIDLFFGHAKFVNSNTVSIDGKSGKPIQLEAKKFLIATGSFPVGLKEGVFDGKRIITSSKGIRLTETPKTILIAGCGAIGTEFASFFNSIGSEVVMVEAESYILPGEDKDVSLRMQSILAKKGVRFYISSRIKKIMALKDRVEVFIGGETEEKKVECEMVLVSVGRKPATFGLDLEKAGVEIDSDGYIPVQSASMRTNVDHIYAAGDVLRTPMLAHTASAEGETAVEASAGMHTEAIDYSAVPNVVYSEIQSASVGLTEKAAKEKDLNITVGKYFFKSNGFAIISGETEGFIKIIANADDRSLVGVHIVGYRAAELIHEFVLAKKAGITVDNIGKTVHAHPTFSETIQDACKSVFGGALYG